MPDIVEAIPEAVNPMANTVRLVLQGFQNGSEVINTFYFKYVAGAVPTQPQLLLLAYDWWTNINAIYRSLLTDKWSVAEITVTDIGHSPPVQAVYQPPAAAGTLGTTPANGNTSLGLRRKTDAPGKSYRGRIMLPPFNRDAFTNDLLGGTYASRMASLATVLMDTYPFFSGNVWRPSVGSKKLISSRPIIAWVFDLVADSMKSRLTGHGD